MMPKPVSCYVKPGVPSGGTGNDSLHDELSRTCTDWNKSVNISDEHNMQTNDVGSVLNTVIGASVFSSSLPVALHEKLNLSSSLQGEDIERETSEPIFSSLHDGTVSNTVGDYLLPDDEEELLAGIADGLYLMNLNCTSEEAEEFDLFSSGGGLEMDCDTQDGVGTYGKDTHNLNNNTLASNSISLNGQSNVPASLIGEHPYGEHPSRTLFVRNINSNVEDSELRALFEHFGDIRTLYTACKHRGFVMISYYDIRSARGAMRALQNKPLRRRKLDIHFSIPKDNPSDKDVNQGTLVVFNLDISVSNDDLRQIFGQYGEIKEIRETPHKRHHKFIEFYDVRAAEAALRALNRSDIAGKRIKLEPSRPGGARRSFMQQLSQDVEQEEARSFWQQANSPVASSTPGQFSTWGAQFGGPAEGSPSQSFHHSLGNSPGMNPLFPSFHGTFHSPNSTRIGTIGSHLGHNNSADTNMPSVPMSNIGIPVQQSHSVPDHTNGMISFYSPHSLVPIGKTSCDGVEGLPVGRTTSDVSLFEIGSGVGMLDGGSANHPNSGGGSTSLSGHQFLWGSSSPYQQPSSSLIWSTPSMGQDFNPTGHMSQVQHFDHYADCRAQFGRGVGGGGGLNSPRFHVGSAPSGDPSNLERHLSYVVDSPDASFFRPSSVRLPMAACRSALIPGSVGMSGGFECGSSTNLGMMPPYRRGYIVPTGSLNISESFAERVRFRRAESGSQADNKKQYQLDIDRILCGEDNRTTLMIKNIPNKYTSKMLLATIDEHHRGTYDFLYLPIDFKNKCNVGYAFINMTSPAHIIPLYQAFNGKKWEKFNSEKVALLAYARIQGKAALVAHFQNSSLMNEDKRCRPILFHSEGLEVGEVIPVPMDIKDIVTKQYNGGGEVVEQSPLARSTEKIALKEAL